MISRQIIRVADEIVASYDQWSNEEKELADEFVLHFLPDALVESAGPELVRQIPASYCRQLVAAILSSRIVYREGCQNICNMDSMALKLLVSQQLICEQKVRQMIRDVDQSNLENKEDLKAILDHAGARSRRELKL